MNIRRVSVDFQNLFFFHSSLFSNYYSAKHFLLCYFIIILFNYAKDQKILPNIEFFFSDRNISAWSISYLVDMSSVFVSSKIQGGLAPPRPAPPCHFLVCLFLLTDFMLIPFCVESVFKSFLLAYSSGLWQGSFECWNRHSPWGPLEFLFFFLSFI
jgi:hypothetical protein